MKKITEILKTKIKTLKARLEEKLMATSVEMRFFSLRRAVYAHVGYFCFFAHNENTDLSEKCYKECIKARHFFSRLYRNFRFLEFFSSIMGVPRSVISNLYDFGCGPESENLMKKDERIAYEKSDYVKKAKVIFLRKATGYTPERILKRLVAAS